MTILKLMLMTLILEPSNFIIYAKVMSSPLHYIETPHTEAIVPGPELM